MSSLRGLLCFSLVALVSSACSKSPWMGIGIPMVTTSPEGKPEKKAEQPPPALNLKRKNLVTMRTVNYEPYRDKFMSLDIGIKETAKEAQSECAILPPLDTSKLARRAWMPIDFYTNARNSDEIHEGRNEGRSGEPNVFWVGDDRNRNGSSDSHDWTLLPDPDFTGSLEFLSRTPQKLEGPVNGISFFLKFARGKLNYKNALGVRSWAKPGAGCEASVYLCSNPQLDGHGGYTCPSDGWTLSVKSILVEASRSGYLSDVFYGVTDPQKKNDVSSLDACVQEHDSQGAPKGDPYRMRLTPALKDSYVGACPE